MGDSNDVQALEKISTEVGDSQFRISLSNQCIKAQAFLFDKLRKQSERQKEICNFINSSNLKLQTEIKLAELEIKSLLIAQATIRSSNVELKKEFLLVKERRSEIEERINNGEKKYEKLWLQAKNRYESIPFVQKLLQSQMKTKTLKENINTLDNKYNNLTMEIKAKMQYLRDLDRKRIIDLAEYIVHVLPQGLKTIQDKTKAINEITTELDNISKEQDNVLSMPVETNTPIKQMNEVHDKNLTIENTVDDGWFNIYQNVDRESIMMPKIQFKNSDFDVLKAKWDKIKTKKDEMPNIIPVKRYYSAERQSDNYNKKLKKDDDFSMYFNNPITEDNIDDCDKIKKNYSKRKLINILEDVHLDHKDAYNIMSKIDLDKLKGVDKIGHNVSNDVILCSDIAKEQVNEEIEVIDLTKKSESLLVPPTPFLDYTEKSNLSRTEQQVEIIVHMSSSGKSSQNLKNSQENTDKKKVSFDIPLSIQEITNLCDYESKDDEGVGNETIDSQVNISLTSDESYTKIKDLILKKHNLDLSPQFTYAKNTTLQMNNNEKIITSKFFQSDKDVEQGDNMTKIIEMQTDKENEPIQKLHDPNDDNPIDTEADVITVSSPKVNLIQKSDGPVSGFLFNHGTQGIPDSLNVSISTTGFDEGDADFPHCIDSSLLLSPKAELPLPMNSNNAEISSQEVPNFLSGLRRTGFFFGQSSAADSKPDISGDNETNNFNFNFGGNEKKGRGLFSMFH